MKKVILISCLLGFMVFMPAQERDSELLEIMMIPPPAPPQIDHHNDYYNDIYVEISNRWGDGKQGLM